MNFLARITNQIYENLISGSLTRVARSLKRVCVRAADTHTIREWLGRGYGYG